MLGPPAKGARVTVADGAGSGWTTRNSLGGCRWEPVNGGQPARWPKRDRDRADELVPAGFRMRPDPGSRTLADGMVITGGYPTRVLRLSRPGARHVAAWWSGMPVPDNPKARALARRLLDTGIAHPVLDGLTPAGKPDVTVVIPVRDRQAELARCLAGLTDEPRVMVVDDGSRDPAAISSIAAAAGASVLRRPVNGEAAARNTGLAAADTPLVAFLDSDCVPGPGWLDALLPHFADPAVGAVAPRIVPHYIGYIRSPGSSAVRVQEQLLEPATTATGLAPPVQVLVGAVLGLVSGALTGIVAALASRRPVRRNPNPVT